MSLSYKQQDEFVIIGSKSGTTRTSVVLPTRFITSGTASKTFGVGEFTKLELNCLYTAGVGETSNSVQIRVEGSPDGTNFYDFVNDSTSGATSTLTQRQFSITQSTAEGTLDYDAQTGNFTAGLVVTGGTSSATALLESDSDAGTTGTLTLSNISGTFQNNETITDSSTGSATVDGILKSVTKFSVPIDISTTYVRVSCKETGVATNAGTIYVEAILSR